MTSDETKMMLAQRLLRVDDMLTEAVRDLPLSGLDRHRIERLSIAVTDYRRTLT